MWERYAPRDARAIQGRGSDGPKRKKRGGIFKGIGSPSPNSLRQNKPDAPSNPGVNLMEVTKDENLLLSGNPRRPPGCPGRHDPKHPKAHLYLVQTIPKQVGRPKRPGSVLALQEKPPLKTWVTSFFSWKEAPKRGAGGKQNGNGLVYQGGMPAPERRNQ